MTRLGRGLVTLSLVLALGGCEEDVIVVSNRNRAAPAPPPPGPGQVVEGEDADAVGPTEYRDSDFVEAETNRDPFRNFAQRFVASGTEERRPDLPVQMPDTGIEEMRVIGIVTGMANPRAMIIDRQGVGHTVSRGDFIGRSEVVQAGGTEELTVTLNWRVERIRPNQIVLSREDPTAPNRPPLTRVLPLRDEAEEARINSRMDMRVRE